MFFLFVVSPTALAQNSASLLPEKVRKIEEAINAEITRQKTSDGKETSYGLGWNLSERNGVKEVSHSGAQQRVSTILYLVSEKGLAVVVMVNLEGMERRNELARQIADIATQ
jgi:CubicO group peptidase (beta-lactamase class C family)